MLEINESQLDEIESKLTDEEECISISFLIPNKELTDDIMSDVDDTKNVPNIMFHDWFYVHIDPSDFSENGMFCTEDEPFRMRYSDNSYDVEDVPSINHNVYYQDSIELDDSIDDNLSNWLENKCEKLGIEYVNLISKLESNVLPDLVQRGDTGVVRASMYKQQLPP